MPVCRPGASGVTADCQNGPANRPLCGRHEPASAPRHPRSRQQTGRSTAIRIDGHSPGLSRLSRLRAMRVEPTAVDSRMGAVMPGRRLPPGTALAADPADAQGETTGLLPVFLPGRRSPDRDIFCPDAVEQHASPARRRSPGRGHRRVRTVLLAAALVVLHLPGLPLRAAPGHLHRCRADGREHGRCRARRGRSARRRRGVWNEEA